MLITWLSLAIVCLLGAMSPGPSFVVVTRNALYRGKSAGLLAAWAHATGIGFWALLTVMGLSVLIRAVPVLFMAISFLGGAYLGWLGIKAISQSSLILGNMNEGQNGSPWRGAQEGGLIAFLNPKTGLFFVALFSPFVNPDAGTVWQCLMVITPFVTDGVWFSVVTFLLVRPKVLTALRAKSLLVNRLSGAVLLVFAAGVFGHALTSLITAS